MPNPYTEHGNSGGSVPGGTGLIFMKFAGGQYKAGRDNRLIFEGTEMIAVMSEYKCGFIHWSYGRPIEERMVNIGSGKSPPWRTELGHNNKELWESDNRGNPQDPWRQTEQILLFDKHTGEFFQFSISTMGGMRALRDLSLDYGDVMDSHKNEWPVIKLETVQWESSSYGTQTSPKFSIVKWAKKTDVPSSPTPPPQRQTEPEQPPFNDEIPF